MGARGSTGSQSGYVEGRDGPRGLGVWIWVTVVLLLVALVVLWLVRAVPEEYSKLRARAEDSLYAVRAERLAAAVAQYRRDTGTYPGSLDELTRPTGPEGYRGPYLSGLPENPGTRSPEWTYDPETGQVGDPAGIWKDVATPPVLTFSDLYVDWGRVPSPRGTDLLSGREVEVRAEPGRPLVVHYFADDDDSLAANMRQLDELRRSGTVVFAVRVRAASAGTPDPSALLMESGTGFPILDCVAQGERLLRQLDSSTTPLTILADEGLNRRARIIGPITARALEGAMDQVWDAYEVAWLGTETRPPGAPDLEPERSAVPAP